MQEIKMSLSYMVGQVSIHDDDVVAGGVLHAVNVGRAQAELLLSGPQHNSIRAIYGLELLGHLERPVRAAVIDDDHFIVVATLFKGLDDQPDDDGQVFSFIISGQ